MQMQKQGLRTLLSRMSRLISRLSFCIPYFWLHWALILSCMLSVWNCKWGNTAPSWKAGNTNLNLMRLKTEHLNMKQRSVLHATCSAIIVQFPFWQLEAQGIKMPHIMLQLSWHKDLLFIRLSWFPNCKELCFYRWEVLSQVRFGPAAKWISPARIQSDYRASTKAETASSARFEANETYVHQKFIWEEQYRHT